MTQQTPQRTAPEFVEKLVARAKDRILGLIEIIRGEFERARNERRGHGLRVIPASQGSPEKLAANPNLTVRLSTEQSERVMAIERDAHSAEHEATTAS